MNSCRYRVVASPNGTLPSPHLHRGTSPRIFTPTLNYKTPNIPSLPINSVYSHSILLYQVQDHVCPKSRSHHRRLSRPRRSNRPSICSRLPHSTYSIIQNMAPITAIITYSISYTSNNLQVINYANNSSRAQSLLTELTSIPSTNPNPTQPRFHLLQADVSSKPAVENLVHETIKTMGRLDVVVSNAGWTRITNFMDIDQGVNDDDWDKCFTMNVKTHLWLAYAAKDALAESEGAFISTASVAGVKPSGSSLPYAVTKAAQIHLVKGLAVILAPKVRVNSVSPGLMLTEWGMKFPQSKRDAAVQNTKLKRLATVEDVADQVRTLALSRSVTGQNLCIDGGSSL